MLASPNFVRFVYHGDGSGTGTKRRGVGNIEKVFTDYFASQAALAFADPGPRRATGSGELTRDRPAVGCVQRVHRSGERVLQWCDLV
jgi:hypothetical protein